MNPKILILDEPGAGLDPQGRQDLYELLKATDLEDGIYELNNQNSKFDYSFVSKVPVQVGQFLQAGAQLFSIVLNNEKWVVANFKETQLDKMVEGQKVEVKIDAFPDEEFIGTVSSIAPATGSTFSILPPDNASGNFVKVVQRVPVKITFNNLKPEIAKTKK